MHLGSLIKQKSYERIVALLRRHPFVFLKDAALFLLLAAIPVGIYYALRSQAPDLLTGTVSAPLLGLLASTYALGIWVFFFTQFVDYFLDAWILTNDRIVNVEQQGLFSRTVSELDLYKIQDVTSEVHGAIPTLFNYGNVHIQTAGEEKRFVFEQVSNPHEIRKQIMDLVDEDRKHHQQAAT
jgi:uncharacterized membrane protein YdbT with pleckstrin-like domain